MKKKLTNSWILFFAVLSGTSMAQNLCHGFKEYEKQAWYAPLLIALHSENKIDLADAHSIKLLSSTRTIPEETTTQLVERAGKIDKSDLILCVPANDADTLLYAVTQHHSYCHLFLYNIHTGHLRRVNNRTPNVLMVNECLELETVDSSGIVFTTHDQNGDKETWIKYFVYNKKDKLFTHSKNCRKTNGKLHCKDLN